MLYVGQPRNIYHRWNSGHHKLPELVMQYGTAIYIRWVLLPLWLLNRAENAAVEFYRPAFNIKTPPLV